MKTKTLAAFGKSGWITSFEIALQFKLQDMWIGCFWYYQNNIFNWEFVAYICIIPCLPIRFKIRHVI